MSPEDREFEQNKLRLEILVQRHQFESTQFWNRGLFFWAFISSIFFGYSQYQSDGLYGIAMLYLATVISFLWVLATKASGFLNSLTYEEVIKCQAFMGKFGVYNDNLQNDILKDNDKFFDILKSRKFSVVRIAILVSVFVFITTLSITIFKILAIFELNKNNLSNLQIYQYSPWWLISSLIILIIFSYLIVKPSTSRY